MRAILQERGGTPEVLRLSEVPVPQPIPTEVLVRVKAAGVNPTDWKTRARGRFAGGALPPFTLGFDVSGVVEAVGDGVTRFAVGDEVFGLLRYPQPGNAYAEYVTAPSRQLAHKPVGLTHVEAAALPLAATTAWQALMDVAKLRRGQRVLVHAAAGGVGHLAGQIARAQGAHVIGTARRDKHEKLAQLGFNELIDYREPDALAALDRVDVILDPIGGATLLTSLDLLHDGGTLVAILPFAAGLAEELERRNEGRVHRMVVEPDRGAIEGIAELVNAGAVNVVIDSTFPLASASDAHRRGEAGRTFGKIVLVVGSDDEA